MITHRGTSRATTTDPTTPTKRRRIINYSPLLIVLAALAMGLPTLRGGFVGGDDRQLALNHVLVNHPSIAHTIKLFTIIHRDLYQPIPLVSFAAEFALAKSLGLLRDGIENAQWLFHLTNVLLHTISSVLVWLLIVTWGRCEGDQQIAPAWRRELGTSRQWVGLVAGLLFAVHPLQVEVVAWVNGRMLLLSTLFALWSLIMLGRWVERPRVFRAVSVVLLVILCSMSKVRVALPVLLVLLPLAKGTRVSARLVAIWLTAGVGTAVLVAINVYATSRAGMLTGAAESLEGSRIVRSMVSLAWYLQHFVVPTGLAAWYPSPRTVDLSDPWVIRAILVVLPTTALAIWAIFRSRVALVAAVWFLATLAATLPIVPSRSTLAADRYMYLPIVGLFWLVATLALRVQLSIPRSRHVLRAILPIGLLVVLLSSLVQSHTIARTYESQLAKTLRITDLFPGEPHVWERAARAFIERGEYHRAIDTAKKELVHEDPRLRSDTLSLIGIAHIRMQQTELGLESLGRAVETDPDNTLARYRFAVVLDDLGLTGAAIPHLERTIAKATDFNPGLCRLAQAYKRMGQPQAARELFERALSNNAYEVPAILGLAELDISERTAGGDEQAERRLRALLDWMPENAAAHTNLGVVLAGTGRKREAESSYEQALRLDPDNTTAALNRAELHRLAGDLDRASALYDRAARRVVIWEQALAIHDYFVVRGTPLAAVRLWEGYLQRVGSNSDAGVMVAWSYALAGSWDEARRSAAAVSSVSGVSGHAGVTGGSPAVTGASPIVIATLALCDLGQHRYESAVVRFEGLCQRGEGIVDARRRLIRGLEMYDSRNPGDPWTICLTARLLVARGQSEAASAFAELCSKQCPEGPCRDYAQSVRTILLALDDMNATDPPTSDGPR